MKRYFKISLIFLILCITKHLIADSEQGDSSIVVTIYVHGTTTKLGLRLLSNFLPELSFGKTGLHHVDDLPQTALLKSDLLSLHQYNSTRFHKEHFYTFGWSGLLSFQEQEMAGKALYDEICILISRYKKLYGSIPKIQILTFSHGGNVALNMVKYLPFVTNEHVPLTLIFVACPVQKVTEYLADHKDIDRIYIISSTRDVLQVMDAYKYENQYYLPERYFSTNNEKCCQIRLKINDRGLSHTDLLRSVMVHIPSVLNFADLACSGNSSNSVMKNNNTTQHKVEPKVLDYDIQDPKFIFYNGFNILSSLRGIRKET